MNITRAKEIQELLNISRPVGSDDELSNLGRKGRMFGIAFWEVCEAVWHWTRHNIMEKDSVLVDKPYIEGTDIQGVEA